MQLRSRLEKANTMEEEDATAEQEDIKLVIVKEERAIRALKKFLADVSRIGESRRTI